MHEMHYWTPCSEIVATQWWEWSKDRQVDRCWRTPSTWRLAPTTFSTAERSWTAQSELCRATFTRTGRDTHVITLQCTISEYIRNTAITKVRMILTLGYWVLRDIPASISPIEEYGTPAFPSLLKFNYTVYTFNRSYSMVLKHGPWHELWKIELLPLITSASDVFCGFPTWTTLPMLMYVSEPALHRSCYRSSKQDGSTSLGTWHGWATPVTCPGLYIRQFAGYPRIGGAAQDVGVTLGFGPWKQTFSRSIMAWTQHGDTPRTEDVGSSSWKRLRSSRGTPVMMMMMMMMMGDIRRYWLLTYKGLYVLRSAKSKIIRV